MRYIACPDAACSIVVSGRSGAGALVAGYLRDFWCRAEHELPSQLAPRFAEIALQMISSAYAGIPGARPDGSCRLTEHRLRIRSYIDAQGDVDAAWADRDGWARRSILNTARCGFFSSDRAIADYLRQIWRTAPFPGLTGP